VGKFAFVAFADGLKVHYLDLTSRNARLGSQMGAGDERGGRGEIQARGEAKRARRAGMSDVEDWQ